MMPWWWPLALAAAAFGGLVLGLIAGVVLSMPIGRLPQYGDSDEHE